MLAALAYARNPPGIWFFNPSKWVEQHMFKLASVWDIPLVKPRFSCMVDMQLAGRGYDLGLALRQTLTHLKGAVLFAPCSVSLVNASKRLNHATVGTFSAEISLMKLIGSS